MTPFLTTDDDEGVMRFRAWAIPVLIAVICASIVASMALAGLVGAGLGMAVGAVAATGLVVFASRSKPDRKLEVAAARDDEHRVLVVATAEATAESAQRIAELAGKTIDVRLLVPVPSHRLDRWMSAEDDARRITRDAERDAETRKKEALLDAKEHHMPWNHLIVEVSAFDHGRVLCRIATKDRFRELAFGPVHEPGEVNRRVPDPGVRPVDHARDQTGGVAEHVLGC